MQRRLRQVCTVVKEHSVVNYAKMATMGGFCNVDHLIVKATDPNDMPLHEKYVHELLKVFSISGQSSIRAFSLSFTRRFGRTRCWRVALKCLVLLHRLLRSVPHDSPFRSELLWIRTNGLISLYPCRFTDDSSLSSRDYTLFVRSYAHLLDEALNCSDFEWEEKHRTLQGEEEHEEEYDEEGAEEKEKSIAEKMKEMGGKLEILPQLQSLIDRVMDCRPTGPAVRSFVVKSAMKHILRDSFACYDTFRKEIVVVLDNLFQMPYASGTAAFAIYKKASAQSEELCEFYEKCKAMGLCGNYEYPLIERIPFSQIQALESFLNGMWQFTDDSSSYGPSSSDETRSSSNDGDVDGKASAGKEDELENKSVEEVEPLIKFEEKLLLCGKEEEPLIKFEEKLLLCGKEEEPLIKFDDESDQHVCWERLLEESVDMFPAQHNLLLDTNSNGYGHGYGYGSYMVNGYGNNYMVNGYGDHRASNSIQVYNPRAANPFDQHLIMQDHRWGFNFSCYSQSPYNNFSSSSK
ncbi:putative clathrin assembly protein At1g03050 [Humulus lupulus]|uniref:putative clathrin assembly protein At1g03050 n=1 Tax=Humulus lupulus TaxID=3486 RepID=UPI002B401A0E|nr:putative clathrin assembly protein At1g03050 [Humulus lupulus]